MAVAQKSPSADAKPVADFSKEQELSAYRTMLTIRRFEEKAGQMYGMGLIGGFCHLYIGQEAVVVGMQPVDVHQADPVGVITPDEHLRFQHLAAREPHLG